MATGNLEIVYGRPGSGKTYYAVHTIAPPHIGRGKFLIYSTGEADDARAFPFGPVVRSVRELDGKPCPEAVCVLGSDKRARLDVLELANRIRFKVGYRVTVLMDESHEVWPEGKRGEADDFFATVRHETGLHLVCITQTPAKLSKNVYRAAMAIGRITWFGLTAAVDLKWIEENVSAEAALLIGELPDRKCIVVDAKNVPPAFRGYVEHLKRKVARRRGGV
jgi:hypothetical protein